MKEYKFLFKPLFYIFSLLLSSWMVLYINETNLPQQHGQIPVASEEHLLGDKNVLKKLISDYKNGHIDSVALDNQLDFFLDRSNNGLVVQKEDKQIANRK
jgi:hypothetical protein